MPAEVEKYDESKEDEVTPSTCETAGVSGSVEKVALTTSAEMDGIDTVKLLARTS